MRALLVRLLLLGVVLLLFTGAVAVFGESAYYGAGGLFAVYVVGLWQDTAHEVRMMRVELEALRAGTLGVEEREVTFREPGSNADAEARLKTLLAQIAAAKAASGTKE